MYNEDSPKKVKMSIEKCGVEQQKLRWGEEIL